MCAKGRENTGDVEQLLVHVEFGSCVGYTHHPCSTHQQLSVDRSVADGDVAAAAELLQRQPYANSPTVCNFHCRVEAVAAEVQVLVLGGIRILVAVEQSEACFAASVSGAACSIHEGQWGGEYRQSRQSR